MNTQTTNPPTKKLKLSKETLQQLSSQTAWIATGSFMPTNTCACTAGC